MFTSLSDRLSATFKSLRGKGRLSEADVDATVREIRTALLEADVALPVVRQFTATVKERALGSEVSRRLNPAQQIVKIVHEELVGDPRRRDPAPAPRQDPADRHPARGSAGRGQDHARRQARAPPQGRRPHPAARRRRPPAPQRRRPAQGRRRARRRRGLRARAGQRRRRPGRGDARPRVELAEAKLHDVVIVDTAGRLAVDADLMDQLRDGPRRRQARRDPARRRRDDRPGRRPHRGRRSSEAVGIRRASS